jgi:hypothetical protein
MMLFARDAPRAQQRAMRLRTVGIAYGALLRTRHPVRVLP